jgi:uncharacterized protein (DUF1499 family)
MRRIRRWLALGVLLAAAAYLYAGWPRINDVETGRTPEYPELRVREYAAGEAVVAKAARAALQRLPRWTLTAEGSGAGGTAIQAVARTRVFRFQDDVTIRIRREGGRTRVGVRSRSRVGKWDFGQNARNIRAFLEQLDRELGAAPPAQRR